MTDKPFVVVIRHRDGSAQTVFSGADLYRVASEAFIVAEKLSNSSDDLLGNPPREVAIECDGQLELSIAVSPGHPL